MDHPSSDNARRPIMGGDDQPTAATPAPKAPTPDPAPTPADHPRRRATDVLGALSTIEAQLAALKQVQADHDDEIAKAQAELDQRAAAIESRERDLESRAAAVNDREAKVKAATDQLTRQREAVNTDREAVAAERKAIEDDRRSLDADRAALKQLEQSLADREATLEADSARHRELAEQAAQRTAALDREAADLRKRCAELNEERDEALGVAERSSAGVEQLRRQIESITAERDEARAEARQAADDTAAVKAEHTTAVEQHERAVAEAQALRTRVEELTREQDRSRDSASSANAEREALRAQADKLTRDLADANATIKELRTKPAATPQGPTPEQVEQLVEQRTRAAREQWEREQAQRAASADSPAQALIADLRARIAQLEAAPAPAPADDTAALRQEVLKRDVAIKALRDKLTAANEQTRSLAERIVHLEAAPPAPAEPDAGPMSGRPDAAKATAKAAEQIAAERTKLAQMAEALAAREAQVRSQAERTASRAVWARASITAFAMLASLALSAAGSWVAVSQFIKPEFNAHAVIEADERERPLTPADRASWQAFHEQLVADPQLLDKVAERMRTRGVKELATASDLHDMIEQRLDVAAPKPGRLAITLRGQGAERTQRILETFLTSLVSYSNSTRDLRRDRTATVVVTPASAEQAPVADPRTRAFIIAAAASGGLAVLITLGVSRAGGRDPFERDTPIELDADRRVEVA